MIDRPMKEDQHMYQFHQDMLRHIFLYLDQQKILESNYLHIFLFRYLQNS